MPNSTTKGLVKENRCECKPTYIWDVVSRACTCYVNSILLSNNTCFSCSDVDNSTNIADPVNHQCICKPTFNFDEDLGICRCPDSSDIIYLGRCFACKGFGNSTGNGLLWQSQC